MMESPDRRQALSRWRLVLGRRDHGLDNRPFGASQITRITKTAAVRSNGDVQDSTLGAPPCESSANTESQPIHRTQQLPGSAFSINIPLLRGRQTVQATLP